MTRFEQLRCPWCGQVNWNTLTQELVGYAIAAGTAYMSTDHNKQPKPEEKKPWYRKLLGLVRRS